VQMEGLLKSEAELQVRVAKLTIAVRCVVWFSEHTVMACNTNHFVIFGCVHTMVLLLYLCAERSCCEWIESSACRKTPDLLRGEDCTFGCSRACTHLRLLHITRVQETQQNLPATQRDAVSRKKTDADNEIEILNFEVRSTCVICAPIAAL
jgi:hypothetical protein